MADVPVSIFTSRKVRAGASPSIPSNAVNEPVSPVNPPGSGNAVPIEHNSTLNKDGGDPVNDFFGHLTEDELSGLQDLLSPPDVDRISQVGTITFTTPTAISSEDWKAIFSGIELDDTPIVTSPVEGTPSTYNRIDSVYYKPDGTVGYVAGVEDPEGAQFPPAIPSGTLRMADILRTPAGDNAIYLTPEDATDFVSKSETNLQTIQSLLAFAQLARTEGAPARVPNISMSGQLGIPSSPALNDVYTTTFGGGGTWSKLVTIHVTVPDQLNYYICLEVAGISANYEKGNLWIQFQVNSTTGDLEVNKLKCFGDMDVDKYKMVRLDSSTYAVFALHNEGDSNYKFRPIFQYGSASVAEYHHQEPRASLPAGDQFDFTLYGVQSVTGDGVGGTAADPVISWPTAGDLIDPDIVDALDGANNPNAGNPFATIDDIPIVPEDFIELGDTPSSYTGQGSKVVSVKSDESGLEFTDPSGGGGADTNAVHYNAADGKTASEKQQARDNIGLPSGIPVQVTTSGTLTPMARPGSMIEITTATRIRTFDSSPTPVDGEELLIINRTGGLLRFDWENALTGTPLRKNQSAPTGFDQIPDNFSIKFVYDLDSNRWVARDYGAFLGAAGGTGVGTYIFQGNHSINNTSGVAIVTVTALGVQYYDQVQIGTSGSPQNIRMFTSGEIRVSRSNWSTAVIRRDEQRLHYLTSITTSGSINDQALTDGIFNYRFTAATDISGFANGEIGRRITIHNATGATLTIEHENAGSIAANRVKLIGAADLVIPIDGKIDIEYCTGSRWELVSKNF